jgi:hypothetical protein
MRSTSSRLFATVDARAVFEGIALAVCTSRADASDQSTIALLLVMLPHASITHIHMTGIHTC